MPQEDKVYYSTQKAQKSVQKLDPNLQLDAFLMYSQHIQKQR